MAPGPVLAVLEAESMDEAIALAAEYAEAPISVWTEDRAAASGSRARSGAS